MKKERLAARYAKALFELALETKIENTVKADMELIGELCKSNKDFIQMIDNPIIKSDKKTAIFKEIFANKIQTISLSFLLLIINKNREIYLEEISKQYAEIYKEYKNIKTAVIETSVKIDDEMKNRIIEYLKAETKSEIELVEKINTDLIGGYRLTFDNKLYDTTIFSQLQKLRKEFNVNIYEKGF